MVSDSWAHQTGLLFLPVVLGIPFGVSFIVLTYVFPWIGILSWFPTRACRVACAASCQAQRLLQKCCTDILLVWGGHEASQSPLCRRKWAPHLRLLRDHMGMMGSKWPLMDGSPMCTMCSTKKVSDGEAAPIRCSMDMTAGTRQCHRWAECPACEMSLTKKHTLQKRMGT